MPVNSEALVGSEAVCVDESQVAEAMMLSVEGITKNERVKGVEPAEVDMVSFCRIVWDFGSRQVAPRGDFLEFIFIRKRSPVSVF